MKKKFAKDFKTNFKTKISQNRVKVISSVVAVLAIITMVMTAIYHANKKQNNQSGISPELAKAMTYDVIEDKDAEAAVDGTSNVKFDAFFLRDVNGDGYAESIRGTSKEIGAEDTLYMELNVVSEGYLENATISINGENFYLQTTLPKDNELADNYIGNNIKEIKLNRVNNGTQKLLTGIVRSGDYSQSSKKAAAIGNNINNYSKVNSITLTGTYVNGQGEKVPVTKTVEFNIDWYGKTTARINTTNQNKDIDQAINEEEDTINLDFTINTEETNKELILSKNHVEGEIPELNGYAPIEVIYTGSNGVFHYDAENRTFTIDRTAEANEEGKVTNAMPTSNSYGIRVVYPMKAYESIGQEAVTIKIPVKTYYEGYNNPSEEFTNPYKSNIAQATIVANYEKKQPSEGQITQTNFEITVGKLIYNPTRKYIISKQKPLRIYNGQSEEENNDLYTVMWKGYVGTQAKLDGMVMKETKDEEAQVSDQFIKTDGAEESVDDVVSNVGIYFSGADTLLGEEGWIKVYDEDTGNLLVTFTQNDWNKYTSNNPYIYEIPVKHIRVETSKLQKNEASLYVYNIKEIEDDKLTTKYTREQFDELQYIKSTLTGYIAGEYVKTVTQQANYEVPISIADISISKSTISTQSTEKNEIITIEAYADETSNQAKWQNGTFLVKLPEEIIDAKLNSVRINGPSVLLENYELVEQDGIAYIKIATKNDVPQTFYITIDVDISADPRIATTIKPIELYASNENESTYYYQAQDIYDVNNNLNTEEQVNYRTTNISMVAPNTLLTNQTASNYDDKGSEIVSPEIADVKPVYAVVDQEQEEQTAKIGVQVKNNYASTISEIQILGKIPFEGNTNVINGEDLGSTFTTTMTNTGIELPEELKGIAKVYYSDSQNPDRDLSKEENNWKTAEEVENWDNIKTYFIDLTEYTMPSGKEVVFYYTVEIPNGLEFNQVAYSHHGIYFSLDTEQGKYRTETSPNKLGFRIAEKYDLELTKYQTGKDKLVPGATYSVTEIETVNDEEGGEVVEMSLSSTTEVRGETKTAVTNSQGKLTITNLYAEKIYEIREIKSPDDYELNEKVIRFIGHVDEEGKLSIEKLEGEIKGEITVTKEEEQNYKVNIQVEDEVKASIKITKKEQGTDIAIQGARFKLTGYNLSENGRSLTTNANGELTFNGLSVNQEYTLQEIKAEGYYLANPIKFKIVNNDGNYTLEKIEDEEATGEIKEQTTTEEDGIPTINIILEDEKIPTYDLQLIKVKKTTESTVSDDELIAKAETALADTEVEYLAGAKFKLYKGTEEVGSYTTDETGKVTIQGLYRYEAEKDIYQTYTLKEVLAPEGYAKVKDITFKAEVVDGGLVLKEINENGEEVDSVRYTAEGNTIRLTIEDSPSFKLIKKDAETQQVLAGVKFAIYNVDDGSEQPATNSKGEIIGTKEIINGKEYYTVSTDENGEITADLIEGLYKAVEVQAPDKYDISDSTYYFGIGASREAPTTMSVEFATSVGGSGHDYINSVASTSDGGIIAGGYFQSSSIQVGEYTLSNNSSSTSYSDGMLIKYSAEGEVEWARSVGGSGHDYINSVASTSDGGYIAGGYFMSSSIQLGEDITLTNSGNTDGMIIKYSSEGEVEWTRSVGGSSGDQIQSVAETKDGGAIVGGYFASSSIQVGEYTLTNSGLIDGMIIKYSATGEVEWARSVGGSNSDSIYSVASTSDGGYIAGGYFQGSSIQVGEYTLSNNSSSTSYSDGMLIKYSAEGEVEWARSVGGSNYEEIRSVSITSDGGYIAGGYFQGSSIQVGEYTLTNNSSLTSFSDGMIIKYDAEGEVEWARSVGGDARDYIYSVASTSDGGIIAGGDLNSDEIQVGEYTLTNSGGTDGMLIKYSTTGEVEWARSVGGSSTDQIRTVAETSDGGYIAGGDLNSDEIQVGEYTLTSNGGYDGMLIKFEQKDLNNPITTQAQSIGGSGTDQITSVTPTSDGGYIAGGYFQSSIQVGEHTLSTNGGYDGMIIKYSASGEVEWARSVGGNRDDEILSVAETSDGGYIAGGDFSSLSIQLGDHRLWNRFNGSSDGMLIKYSTKGEVEWAKSIEGNGKDQIQSVAPTSDGGVIVGGDFSGVSIQVGDYTLTNFASSLSDGMIIKYNSSGEVEWAKSVGGSSTDEITSVTPTSDGGYIAGGYFYSSEIQVGDYTLTNNGSQDGMIIKYNSSGEVEWTTSVGRNGYDNIYSVSATSDGGYIAGGHFSGSIQVGEDIKLTSNGNRDGMIIKYDVEGKVQWARSVGGSSTDQIRTVAETSDGGIIAGGYFNSISIQAGDYTLTNNSSSTSYSDGMIIKYDEEGKTEWAKGIGGSKNDYINSVAEANNGKNIVGGYFNSISIQTGDYTLTNNSSSTSYTDGMILEVANQVGVPEIQELTVENSRKEFKITTDVKEIDGVKGGNISGEDKNPYEKVKYGENSTNEIKMIPDENYEIISITVNGEEYPFEANEDGTYTMPQFTNITEDKHIEVTYALKDNKLTINKVDSKTKAPLAGATFKIDQIEERTEPENVIGPLTANGETYYEANTTNEITDVQGELTNNGTYYFVQNEDGTLTPTNSKTYQLANGGTAGIGNTTANSYVEIDLSGLEGKYIAVVNANVSSQSSNDYGYATINQSTSAPSYNTSTGRFMYISGTSSTVTTPTDYESEILEGGNIYYLHLGYRKSSSTDTGDDQVVINSIKVYGTNSLTYNFIENNEGGYESNNQGQDSTTANAYIPIDLTNNTGKYNLTVNAQISSQSVDYGYATVTTSTDRVAYNTNTTDKVRFVYISGEEDAQDYTTVLQGGQMYYLHLGYYKNTSTSSGDDKFTVNGIQVSLNDSELYHTEVTTDSKGQGIVQIPFGKYAITETKAPEGYELKEEPTIIEFRADGENHEITIENQAKAKVIVHHYLKTEEGYTTTKVAEDDVIEKTDKETYTTTPKLDLEKYELEKDEEGNYVIPEKATGNFVSGETIEVTYYYEEKEIPLTVHHYIEGTTQPVPLKDGTEAEDVTDSGKEGTTYQTSEIEDSLLSDAYEIAEIPENAEGIYTGQEIIVTYYYKLVERPLTIVKTGEDGESLEGVTFEITTKENPEEIIGSYTTNAEGKITVVLPVGEYNITETETQEGYAIPENPTQTIEITKEKDSYELAIENKKAIGTVITHYYKEGTEEKVPSTVEGEVVEDAVQTGKIGDIYITEEATNVSDRYELKQIVGKINGTIDEEYKEIIYYYGLKEANLTLVKTNEQGEGLEGAYIKIENKESGKVKYVTTGANGEITEKVEIGENVVTEERAPEGYKVNRNPQTINVELDKENKITIQNEPINYYTLELSKVDSETNESVQGAKFTLSYTTQYGEEKTEEYETTSEGNIILNNLEDEIEYTLEETQPAKGYVANTQTYKFIVHYEEGTYELEMLEGTFDGIETEGKDIKCIIKNTPTLKVIKQGENGELLANAKFTITDEEGKEVRNGKGELVGEEKEINGEVIRVVTTDEQGRIIENLEPGKYILTEVEAPEGYELAENEEDRKTEIEITSAGYAGTKIEKSDEIYIDMSNVDTSWMDFDKIEAMTDPIFMNNGNIAFVGGLKDNYEISSENTVLGEDIILEKTSIEDGLILVLNSEGKVKEVYQNSSPENAANTLVDMLEIKEGKKIAIGMYMGAIEIPAEKTANNQVMRLEATDNSTYTYMISYNAEGKVENLTETYLSFEQLMNDIINVEMVGDKIVVQYYSSDKTITIPGNFTVTGEEMVLDKENSDNPVMLVYNMSGKVEKVVEVKWNIEPKFQPSTAILTTDGEIVMGGYLEGDSVIFDETETVSGEQIELNNPGDGIIVKYNAEGKVEWAKNLGSTQMGSYGAIKEVENGYITLVAYMDKIIIPAEETVNGEQIELEVGANKIGGALIKYNAEGKVESVASDESIDMLVEGVSSPEQIELRETEEGYALISINNENGAILKYKETYTETTANKQEIVTITNKAKDSTVLVHHYIKDTTTKLSEDVLITGKVGSDYHTEVAADIPSNYELVVEPEDKDGKITANQIEVTYYYQLKEPEILDSNIEKESTTEKITTPDQLITYNINYTAKVDTYIGKATVTIVDELPYEIDEARSNIAGGAYDSEEKTITWIEEIGNIDTFANSAKEISIEKEISLVFKDIDVTQTNVENRVTGTIKLETPEKEETIEDTKEIPTEYLTKITVNKIWNENDIQANRRPDSLILVVKNGDQEVKTVEITKDNMVQGTTNQWSIVIDGLQKYDDNGEEIDYSVEEKEKNTDGLKFYIAEENPVKVEDNQATIRNNFVKPDDKTSVTVNKVWNDNNNVNQKRPESIVVKVTGNGQTYTQEIDAINNEIEGNTNGWTYTFTNLPKYDENGQEIVYTASEEEANTDDLKFYTNDGTTGDMTSGYTITNTFTVPDERIELTVNKNWVDNSTQAQRRPGSIVINVKAENADNNDPEAVIDTYELNTETEISHTFTNLPKYNSQGDEIQYIVEEQEKNPGDLHFYTSSVGTVENTDENTKEVTITNTFEKPDDKTEVTVTKVWNDNNDEAKKRPESINLQLKNRNVVEDEQVVNESNKVDDQRKEEIIAEINERNNATNNENVENTETDNQLDVNSVEVWQYTFTEVEKYNEDGQEIAYTADETEVNSNDLQFYNKTISGLTVTNTFTHDTTKVTVPVTKVWEDNDIQAQRRPESVVIVLKANGIEDQRYELSEETAETVNDNTWTYTFTELPKYDEYNNIINYTIEEEEKTAGDLKFYTSKVDGYTITNTFTRPTDMIRIEVHKEWVDQENAYEKRPNSIRLEVKQGESVVQSEVVTKDDNWSATFIDLAKYDENGQEIEYTVDEEEVMENDLFNYEKEIGEITDKNLALNEKEATITNTMTKIPSTVVVKYVDKYTGEEISDSKTKEGIIGDTFDVTEDKKEITGYTLVEEPEEKEGVYTAEPQEKIYYYAKNTKVIVKYLEQDSTPEDIADNQVLADEVTIEGYEGKEYTTQAQNVEGYTLVATTDNLEGTMERDEIVVIYYYAPNTNVIVKYLEQDNTPNDNSDNKVLAPEVNIDGYVGKEYTTQAQDVDGYTLVATTDNLEGTMTKDPIEVIYYYAQNTKVIVKYLEKDETPEDNTDNQVLADEIEIPGYEGLEYETEQKKIENYTFVESTNNTSGQMAKEVIEVIYYYAQNTKATVQHIDRETGEILKEESQDGKVGDLFETQPEDFDGYVLVESPEEPNIIMDKTGEQVVKYYYAHVSAGVIEKHIDDITGELLYSEEHQGNEGDPYNIPAKEFEGYDLVTEDTFGNSRLPDNAEGEMKRDEVIEVKYYYIKKAKVIVKYLEEDETPEDTTDNQVLAEGEIIEGHENDNYETEAKEIEGYDLVEIPENAIGTMVITKNPDGTYNTEIEVIYYYKKVAGGVIENHIDITTGNKLAVEEHRGNVGDLYDIPPRTFEGYDLVTEDENGNNMLPTNAKGEMTEEQIVVNYYYIKQAKVKVEYIDKQTGEKLDEEEIEGHIGDSYDTEEKQFDGYELVEKPSNSTGEMTEEETVVKYYYQRKAEVEVKYLEKGTEYEIAPSETIEGYVGDNYETMIKEIPYYNFVEKTDNYKGTMKEDKITVIYYYEKLVFNLGIDKWVSSVNVNGISQGARNINNKDEMYVVDIHRSKTDTANVKVTYKIRVTNKGEIEGTAREITEVIPAGYSYYEEDNEIHWEERYGSLVTEALKDETIEPGEYKEIEIVLRWNPGENNFGEKENLVILSGEENPAGYEDVDKGDNHSSSDMMITVATGLDRNGRIILTASITMVLSIILAVNVGLLVAYKEKQKKKK